MRSAEQYARPTLPTAPAEGHPAISDQAWLPSHPLPLPSKMAPSRRIKTSAAGELRTTVQTPTKPNPLFTDHLTESKDKTR